MNDEIKEMKIGMYTTDEILEFMTNGEGRGFMGRSMYDAILDCITNLQQNYERIYNENCKLREEHNITDISLLDELEDYKSRCEKASKLLKNKKEEYSNLPDYHQYYVDGYDKAIELTHSSHSGVMLETIKSATIKNCDDLLNILDSGSEK